MYEEERKRREKMKVSKAGIKMYEPTDNVKDPGDAANQLRKEVNKIALVLDEIIEKTGLEVTIKGEE